MSELWKKRSRPRSRFFAKVTLKSSSNTSPIAAVYGSMKHLTTDTLRTFIRNVLLVMDLRKITYMNGTLFQNKNKIELFNYLLYFHEMTPRLLLHCLANHRINTCASV